ncbi:MAG: molybdopterin molybdotransferase MoeA [Acidihalobacter sp.]|uniref:molybdopterin molybdotransferase MoeA n=1 Tax=Acidihalobacter sp. TaxID=1872108 RepID=UPI00307E137F
MQANTCDTDFDPKALTEEQARKRILASSAALDETQRVALIDALGRVLAGAVEAPFDVPPHRNSAMDGYALRAEDQNTDTPLRIIGRSFAGHPFDGSLQAGECVHIMTGAVVPEGADTVIQQELTESDGQWLRLQQALRTGANVRHPGEDLRRGQTVLESGRCLTPADLGLLASLGIGEIEVHRLPRVAFFSTGDELRAVGEPLREGEIHDSNRYVLHGLLQNLGVEILDLGRIPDRADAVHDALTQAEAQADVIITTGGASVGEADYVTGALRELGEADFWKIAIKPGRPLNFGRIGQALFFGLPGNPVSAIATFALFVAPCLRRLRGEADRPFRILRAITHNDLKKSPGRTDFQRGILHTEPDGSLSVVTTGLQGSHMLSSMSRADCFIRLPRESGPVAAGSSVEVMPFSDLLY